MSAGLLLVGVVALTLLAVFLYALFRISGENDRAARRAEKELIPHSDVTVTVFDRSLG